MIMSTVSDFATGLQHIGVPTNDMEASKQFYLSLGFSIALDTYNKEEHVVFFRLGNLTMEVYENHQATLTPGAVDHVCINVTDVEKALERTKDLGYEPIEGGIQFLPFWENGVRYFTIYGPNREKIEFGQYL
mgnify:CR=1 FL=1